jgi:RNA polymerase sigma factor (sigma-70 family)
MYGGDPSEQYGCSNQWVHVAELGTNPESLDQPGGDRRGSPDEQPVLGQDLGAAQATVARVAPAMHAAVRSVMGPSHPDIEDVVQQALIAFVQSLPRFRGECLPTTYALRIAIRAALGARKRSCRLQAPPPEDARDELDDRSPAEQMQAEKRRALVRQLLDELPVEQAEALTLHVVLDLSLKAVAEATGVPLNTVKSRLRLAKRALRQRIAANRLLADELEVRP